MNFVEDIRRYREREIETLQRLNLEEISEAMNVVAEAWRAEKDIYVCGNGGSAATASHMVNDFNKGVSEYTRKKFRMHCLCDNMATVTAIANDTDYSRIFCHQLEGRLREGDVLIAISGSGNSPNVVKAAEYARELGARVIGITGYTGGRLKELGDYHMHVPVEDMQITEDVHVFLNHMMMSILGRRLSEEEKDGEI